jgi:catechol 2,3-dioxygenase-like lactoylglutathione lyase family enzyme
VALARWKDLCVDVSDPQTVAAFWSPLLGLEAEPAGDGVTRLRGDSPVRTVWVNTVPEPKTVKNRVHLDLVLPTVEPLVAGGAAVEHSPEPGWEWHVLTDPEGNELCVFPAGQGWPTALVVDASDEQAIAAWWSDVLGARLSPGPEGLPRWLRDVAGLPFEVWKFVNVPDRKTVKNRWHWGLVCDDVEELVRRGATPLRGPDGDIDWHVLADPEGNEFCVFTSS